MTKKFLLPFIFVLIAYFSAAQTTISNQPTKSWTWSNYKINFQAPTDLAVKESSAKVFYAGSEHVFIIIYPKTGDSLTHENLPQAVQKWATDNKVNFSPSNSGYLSNSNRYWSYYVGGSGYKGMSTYVAVIVDSSKPEDSYYVWLQYQNGYADTAMNILNSFSPQ